MVAAVNPCGFALLVPGYLALDLGRGDASGMSPTVVRRLVLAACVGLTITAGFTLLFAVAGLLLGAAATALVHLFRGRFAVDVLMGARLVNGPIQYTNLGERIADRIGGRARRAGPVSFSCTGGPMAQHR